MTDNELEQLQEFLARANALFAGGFLVNDSVELTVPFRSSLNKPSQNPLNNGEWINDRLRAKLVTLRGFYNGKDVVNFNRICNLVYRGISDNEKKVTFATIRDMYSAIFRRLSLPDQILSRLRSQVYTPQSSLEIWQFWVSQHVDSDPSQNEEIWKDLVKSAGRQRLEFVVYNTTYELAKCVKLVKEFVEAEYAPLIRQRLET